MHDILNGFTQLWYSTGIYGFLTEEKGWGMAVMIVMKVIKKKKWLSDSL